MYNPRYIQTHAIQFIDTDWITDIESLRTFLQSESACANNALPPSPVPISTRPIIQNSIKDIKPEPSDLDLPRIKRESRVEHLDHPLPIIRTRIAHENNHEVVEILDSDSDSEQAGYGDASSIAHGEEDTSWDQVRAYIKAPRRH